MSLTTAARGNEPRCLPVAARDGSAHPGHSVQFYEDDAFLLDEVGRFIGGALGAGNATLVISTEAHRDGLTQRLGSLGFDTVGATQQGRYIVLDAAETLAEFMREGQPDVALFAEVVGGVLDRAAAASAGKARHIAAFGEMVTLLLAEGNVEAAVRLEQLWNDLSRAYSLSLRCAYPMRGFDREDQGDSFLRICAEHSHVIPVESYGALATEEERLRSITHLQQRAQALETEMAERKEVEENLRRTKADLEFQVERRTAALRQLSSRLLSLQDTERRRLARELHDSLGQYLVGLKLNVDMLRQSPERQQLWSEAEQLLQQCICEVRTLSYLLHPPTMDAAGLASAARWYVEGFGQRSGLEVALDAPAHLRRLPDATELALFRVLQEALTNVHRHSGASAAHVAIWEDAGQLVLEVKDNGRGMPADLLDHFRAKGAGVGVGLAGIRERARELGGKMELESNSSGTLVRVAVPVLTAIEAQFSQ